MIDEKIVQLTDIIKLSSIRFPDNTAIQSKQQQLTYTDLKQLIDNYANHLISIGVNAGDKVAVYDGKTPQTIASFFAIALIGAIFIPINPLLKQRQLVHILKDSQSDFLITSEQRLQAISKDLSNIKIIFSDPKQTNTTSFKETYWPEIIDSSTLKYIQTIEKCYQITKTDKLCALFYTSGSTGKAKGVCISHQNFIKGTQLVADYCQLDKNDKILSLLPFSFDYGFNQLCTSVYRGASLILLDYLLPKDIAIAIEDYQITGLAGVPSLWVQFDKIDLTPYQTDSLRFITNSGGKLPNNTIKSLANKLPKTQIYLMYGLTEAFRSTYLSPNLIHEKTESMGKALNNEEIYVIDEDGKPCEADQIGELVHRGELVSMGYWNRPEENQKRFKELNKNYFAPSPHLAVFSGDRVKMDAEGFLYFIGREDDQIKCSGNRISPTEIEETLYEFPDIKEAVVIGVPHSELGQAIVMICSTSEQYNEKEFIKFCRLQLPNFMQAKKIIVKDQLPQSINGKFDRKYLENEYKTLFIRNGL